MKQPDIPQQENLRVQALRDLGLLDSGAEERFDRLTRIAKNHFKAPIVLISLVDSDRLWFKSRIGINETQIPRAVSFCGHTILSDELFCIPDALEDERFSDNPLVTGPPHIRFYAGAPLKTPNGYRFGTLCIIDTRPRILSEEDRDMLKELAASVQHEVWMTTDVSIQLAEQAIHLKTVVDTVLDSILTIDVGGVIQMANLPTEAMFGYHRDELIGKNISILMPESYARRHDQFLRNYLQSGIKKIIGTGREAEGRKKDGTVFPVELAVTEITGPNLHQFVGVIRDLTDLYRQERFMSEIVDNIPSMVFVKEAEGLRYTLFNKAGEDLLGKTRIDIIGKSDYDFLPQTEAIFFTDKDREVLRKNQLLDIPEETISTPRGERILHTRKVPISDSRGVPRFLLGISDDITDKKAMEEELHNMARKDMLTGLANRHTLHQFLQNEFSRCQRTGGKVACLFIDLDGFKPVNDTHGHNIGDEVLVEIAGRLEKLARDIDCMTRLGGDEFILVLSDVGSLDQAGRVAERVRLAVKKPVTSSIGVLSLSASIGIAIYPGDADNLEELIRIADHRMYEAKKANRADSDGDLTEWNP